MGAPPPRFVHEEMVSPEAPQAPGQNLFTMYERMSHIREAMSQRAIRLGLEGKRASSVFTRRRVCYDITDQTEFVKPPSFNDSFN